MASKQTFRLSETYPLLIIHSSINLKIYLYRVILTMMCCSGKGTCGFFLICVHNNINGVYLPRWAWIWWNFIPLNRSTPPSPVSLPLEVKLTVQEMRLAQRCHNNHPWASWKEGMRIAKPCKVGVLTIQKLLARCCIVILQCACMFTWLNKIFVTNYSAYYD